jgi:hypothetical protein
MILKNTTGPRVCITSSGAANIGDDVICPVLTMIRTALLLFSRYFRRDRAIHDMLAV